MLASIVLNIFKKIKQGLSVLNYIHKLLFYKYYYQAKSDHLKRHYKNHWRPLTKYLEYDLHLANILSDGEMGESKILIRKTKDIQIDSVCMIIEAINYSKIFQSTIHVENLDKKPIEKVLMDIPLQEMYIFENKIAFTYDKIKITIKSIISDGNILVKNYTSQSMVVTHRNFMGSRWIKKYGQVWNIDYLYEGKQHLKKIFLRSLLSIEEQFSISTRFVAYYPRNRIGVKKLFLLWICKIVCCRSIWGWCRYAIFRFITSRTVINVCFWFLILTKFAYINEERKMISNYKWMNSKTISKLFFVKHKTSVVYGVGSKEDIDIPILLLPIRL